MNKEDKQPALIIYLDGAMEQLLPVTIGWLLDVGNGIIRQAQSLTIVPPTSVPKENEEGL